MKLAGVLFLCMTAILCAQEKDSKYKKRLQSVTWDLKSHKLVWTVQRGSIGQDGKFVGQATDHYEITPDEAVMTFANEQRGFTTEEAVSLRRLLDTLSLYCAESVIWWDRGQGEKLDKQTAAERRKVQYKRVKPAPPATKYRQVASLAR